MDSQERHELKQNDLEEFLTHFNEWWKKNGTYTLLVIFAIVAGIVGYNYVSNYRTGQLEGPWGLVQTASSPTDLQQVANDYPDRPVGRFALLQAGDLLLNEARIGKTLGFSEGEQTLVDLTAEQRQQALERARKLYEQILPAQPRAAEDAITLNARMGLAATLESLGEFDLAVAQYDAVIAAADRFHLLRAQAERQKAQVQKLREPVQFAPAPEVDAEAEADAGDAAGDAETGE